MDVPRPVELLWDNRDALTGHVGSNANLFDLAEPEVREDFANARYLAFYELRPGDWRVTTAQLMWVIY